MRITDQQNSQIPIVSMNQLDHLQYARFWFHKEYYLIMVTIVHICVRDCRYRSGKENDTF